jgi:hypothetical protein
MGHSLFISFKNKWLLIFCLNTWTSKVENHRNAANPFASYRPENSPELAVAVRSPVPCTFLPAEAPQ